MSFVLVRVTIPVLPREAPPPSETEHERRQRELEEAFFADADTEDIVPVTAPDSDGT